MGNEAFSWLWSAISGRGEDIYSTLCYSVDDVYVIRIYNFLIWIRPTPRYMGEGMKSVEVEAFMERHEYLSVQLCLEFTSTNQFQIGWRETSMSRCFITESIAIYLHDPKKKKRFICFLFLLFWLSWTWLNSLNLWCVRVSPDGGTETDWIFVLLTCIGYLKILSQFDNPFQDLHT